MSRERCALGAALADLDPASTGLASDPFFARRVMAILPPPLRGGRLSPQRRARVLAVFYAAAVLVGVGLAWIVPDAMLVWSDRAHGLAHGAVETTGGAVVGAWPVVLGVLAAVVGGVLALAPSRIDTPAT